MMISIKNSQLYTWIFSRLEWFVFWYKNKIYMYLSWYHKTIIENVGPMRYISEILCLEVTNCDVNDWFILILYDLANISRLFKGRKYYYSVRIFWGNYHLLIQLLVIKKWRQWIHSFRNVIWAYVTITKTT